jgi:hypothetical protein
VALEIVATKSTSEATLTFELVLTAPVNFDAGQLYELSRMLGRLTVGLNLLDIGPLFARVLLLIMDLLFLCHSIEFSSVNMLATQFRKIAASCWQGEQWEKSTKGR